MSYLILVRHGLSEHNKKGLWAGWIDSQLTKEGIEEARKAGEKIKDIPLDICFTSSLSRAKDTLSEIKKVIHEENLPTFVSKDINERNYGVYSGKNKWEVKKQIGENEFLKLRRSWNYPIPEGESLRQVYERVIPYYLKNIFPCFEKNKNVLIVSSGNSLRSLVKYLEKIPDETISSLEIGTGEVYVYKIDEKGIIQSKEIRAINENKGKI